MRVRHLAASGVALALLAAAPAVAGAIAAPASGAPAKPVIVLSAFAQHERAAVGADAAAPSTVDASGAASTVAVTVDGGPLAILDSPSTITLTRSPGTQRYRGTVEHLVMVDARGTNQGWTLRAGVASLSIDGETAAPTNHQPQIDVRVQRVVANAASIDGVHATGRAMTVLDRPARVLDADAGAGSGSFEITLSLEVTLPGSTSDHTRAVLRFDVG